MPRVRSALLVAAALTGAALSAAPAAAETVRGTFTFLDGDGDGDGDGVNDGSAKPIRDARVEILRYQPTGFLDYWDWRIDVSTTTDADGRIDVTLPFIRADVVVAVKVYATNRAVQVMQENLLWPFKQAPMRGGAEVQLRVAAAGDVLDFTAFYADGSRNYFNIADAALYGFDYAAAHRDPRETDVVRRVDVMYNSSSSYYELALGGIRLATGHALDDFTILHEYSHYLEAAISSFYGVAAHHDGCNAEAAGFDRREPGYAWMEGFASYLPAAIALANPGKLSGSSSGSIPSGILETPACVGSSLPAGSLERPVAGALFDLVDPVGEFPHDRLAGRHREVFQIFDRELDLGWTNPTIDQFIAAWGARGLDLPRFRAVMIRNGMAAPPPPRVAHYDFHPAANPAVWRPSTGTWIVDGGVLPAVVFGQAGDVPLPADYDGDGVTDLAVWRPGASSTWFVKKSSGGAIESFPWGTATDLPLPADYDNDGEVDYAVFRPGTGQLFIAGDTADEGRTVHLVSVPGSIPTVGYLIGEDSVPDVAFYDRASGWFTVRHVLGDGLEYSARIGEGGAVPVIHDYDEAGRDQLAVYVPDTGEFFIRDEATRLVRGEPWGAPGELPVPADYDGDGDTELATWASDTGEWFIRQQGKDEGLAFFTPVDGDWAVAGAKDTKLRPVRLGADGDVPVPAR